MLHGGVSITLCRTPEKFWIPKMRSLVKKVVHDCSVCRRFRATPVSTAKISASTLPNFRVELSPAFSVTGVDFAGPVYYKSKAGKIEKAYIALFTCASTRAVYLKLCSSLTASEFQKVFKEFVARVGPPQTLVSDNGKTFVGTGKWLSILKKDESLGNDLGKTNITWKFNLSRAPWWGGFFERLVGIMKSCLSKVIGRRLLTYEELEEVLLDIETTMNNRPLSYQGEEFEQPVITPNILTRGRPTTMLEEDIERIGEENVTKRMKFLQQSKEHLRKRFLKEYVYALMEKQGKSQQQPSEIPEVGAVVMLKGDTKDKALWKIGRVVCRITGRDGAIRGLKIKQGNGYVVERPLQLICDLEIGGDDSQWKPNLEAQPFRPRTLPARQAKEIAKDGITCVRVQEENET